MSQWKSTASEASVPQRQWAVLGILGRQSGLPLLSAAGQVSERDGQGRDQKAAGQLFQALGPAAFR